MAQQHVNDQPRTSREPGASQPGSTSAEAEMGAGAARSVQPSATVGANQPGGTSDGELSAAAAGVQASGTVGAAQPGGTRLFEVAVGAPEAEAETTAAPVVQPTGTVGATQPGGNSWEGSDFLTQTLPRNQEKLRRECPQLLLAKTSREAIDKAYTLEKYLPLSVSTFADFDFLSVPGVSGGAGQPARNSVAAVVAERIPRVPDNNRPPSCRVDFFVYCRNGDVIRHHPGHTAPKSMKPHRMPSGSVLFSLASAQQIGVGASLHLFPPCHVADAGAPQPGVVLCTRRDVDEICPYDIQMVSWRYVREAFLEPGDEQTDVDISDGHLFPWWLLLGGTGRQRAILDRGVTHIVASGKSLVVTLQDGEVIISSNRHSRMELRERYAD